MKKSDLNNEAFVMLVNFVLDYDNIIDMIFK